MRVVSLLPSATEMLAHIGGAHLLVGRSHECDTPPSVAGLPVLTAQNTHWQPGRSAEVDRAVSAAVGAHQALYRLDTDLLRALRPDVILTQDLCDVCSIDLAAVKRAAAAMDPRPKVVSLNAATYESVLDDLLRVGEAVGLERQAREALLGLRQRFFAAADHVNAFTQPVPTLFLEWIDPPFVGGHWNAQLVERAGGANLLNPTRPMVGAGAGAGGQMAHRVAGKSIRVTPEAIAEARPEAVVVCPCGLSLADVRREADGVLRGRSWWEGLPAVRAGRVALVDGNQMFNRPGPRLVDAYEFLVGWLNGRPDLIPAGFPWSPLSVR
ncbi:MAG: ABC transporter substrate-binding protein [Phycisphaerales bacterium]|nr:ABC transporter substrate-binding protein [Phycisphaerales bacterium]